MGLGQFHEKDFFYGFFSPDRRNCLSKTTKQDLRDNLSKYFFLEFISTSFFLQILPFCQMLSITKKASEIDCFHRGFYQLYNAVPSYLDPFESLFQMPISLAKSFLRVFSFIHMQACKLRVCMRENATTRIRAFLMHLGNILSCSCSASKALSLTLNRIHTTCMYCIP